MKNDICTSVVCADIVFLYIKPFVKGFWRQILQMIYKKLRKILELRDWQPPGVCDNICVGTFINF